MRFHLLRVAQTTHGTFGVLLKNYSPFCLTLEDAWLGNASNISCIPSGIYTCSRFQSSHHGETFLVEDVPGRSGVLFHLGNFAGSIGQKSGDTDGCILLADSFKLNEKGEAIGIFPSKAAVQRFLSALKGVSSFSLEVTPARIG